MTLVADFNRAVGVPFQRMRQLLLDQGLQEGVVGATDLKVAQRGAGANQSVDVGAGFAWVQIDTGTRNGLGHVTSDTTANVTVTASNATNPRVDQIVLRWNDVDVPTGAGNVPTLEVLTGTATSGATLDNRTGATALPNDVMRLADILVPAASTSVTTANIRDRRPWARGAYSRIVRTAGNYTTASTTRVAIDTTNLQPRIECSGAPLRITLSGFSSNSVAGSQSYGLFMDSAALDGTGSIQVTDGATPSFSVLVNMAYTTVPVAGSHLFAPIFATTAGTLTLAATAGSPLTFVVEEIVRQNANNT